MATWLERVKREFPSGADRATAEADERNPTAVMAVPEPDEPKFSRCSIGRNGGVPTAVVPETEAVARLTDTEEHALRTWLAHIEETDEAIVADVLDQCRTDADARGYFLHRASELPRSDDLDDDRRRCSQCANLTQRGVCLAAWRGEICASRSYEPIRDLLRRCETYAPGPDDTDRRPGCERWPGLTQKGRNDANT